jgi:hypothetical protein
MAFFGKNGALVKKSQFDGMGLGHWFRRQNADFNRGLTPSPNAIG